MSARSRRVERVEQHSTEHEISGWATIPPIQVKRLDPELPLPRRAHPEDAGADLYSAQDLILQPGERALVRTGVAIALPIGTVGLIHPRSGMAAKHGLSIVNTPGTIDAGYRGELMVCLLNTDRTEAIEITRGMRIAQLVIQRVELAQFEEVDQLDETERGSGGYGSTGTH
ncbi:dUTP diphosphatase [Corynebacterium mucifaciens]